MLSPTSSLTKIPGIGPAIAQKLGFLGLETVSDLLYHLPRAWEDLTHLTPIAELQADGSKSTVRAHLTTFSAFRTPRRRMMLTQGILSDETGSIPVVWFNQPYLKTTLKKGTEYYLTGKVERNAKGLILMSPSLEPTQTAGEERTPLHSGRIVPVYPESLGITTKIFRRLIKTLLPTIRQLPDYLPTIIRQQYQLTDLSIALEGIHFPANLEILQIAKDRLGFDELLLTQLAVQSVKRFSKQASAEPIATDIELIKQILAKLPYQLTNGQKRALWEILQDLADGKPTNRLLQGDVGSGKTILVAILMTLAAKQNFQSALMVPTEVLARQHYFSIAPLLKEFGVNCALRTQAYQAGPDNASVFIGTHALIQTSMHFNNLNLVIVDEQHRFGVKQREALKNKMNNGTTPHFISLTATPIPRSLALTVFGDLDISVIPHKPLNRKPIITQALESNHRQVTYKRMLNEIENGHQVFVITPLIEISTKLSAKSAEAEYKNIQRIFPHAEVGLLHGRLTSDQKTDVMTDFKTGKLNILVATTGIEVGIDIPNATVMLIEGAERFGMSQLHQLRGRVGRSELQSYCFVIPTDHTPEITERLGLFAKTLDGFKLAELDLQLRGPGAIFGHAQSGFLNYRLANWTDTRAIKRAQDAANAILDEDITLEKYPELAKRINLEAITAHSE